MNYELGNIHRNKTKFLEERERENFVTVTLEQKREEDSLFVLAYPKLLKKSLLLFKKNSLKR